MERTYMKEPFETAMLSERSYGFVVRTPAIQYDIGGEPCVLVVTCDGFGDLYDEIKKGRAYLHPQRVTLIGEYEPGVTLLHSDRLRNGTLVFTPGPPQPVRSDDYEALAYRLERSRRARNERLAQRSTALEESEC